MFSLEGLKYYAQNYTSKSKQNILKIYWKYIFLWLFQVLLKLSEISIVIRVTKMLTEVQDRKRDRRWRRSFFLRGEKIHK